MDKQSLTYKTFKNISYSFVGYIATFVFAFFITPIIVFKLGVETYGIYVLVLTVNSLLGLFDLGIGSILIKYIAEYQAAGDEQRLKQLMYSFNTILLIMSVFSLAVLMLVGYQADIFFPGQAEANLNYFLPFFLSGLVALVNGITALFTIVPVALQRIDLTTKIGLANLVLSNLSVLAIVLLGYGLNGIFLIQLFFAVAIFILYRHYAKRLLPSSELKLAWHWPEIKKAYKFGLTTYVSNAANSALTYFDRLLIPIFLGPSALSYYSLPGNIASKTPGVVNSLSGILFPMISSLHGSQDLEKIKNIYRRTFNLLTVISFAITLSIILFADKLLLFWLDADFAARSSTVLIILTLTYYFLSLGGTLNNFLLGLTRTKLLFYSSVTMAILNIILLVVLLPKFGIIGAAWAYLLSVLPIIYMFYHTEKKFLRLTGRGLDYLKLYAKLALVSLIFVSLVEVIILPLVTNLLMLVIFGPISVLLFLLLYRLFRFLEPEDLEAINAFLKIVFAKFKLTKKPDGTSET